MIPWKQSGNRIGKTHLIGEEKKKFISLCYEIMNSQGVHFTDSKGAMAAVIERDGKLEVTSMSLNQVAEQVLMPCLPPEYSHFNRNQVVKLLKWFQKSITEWLKDLPEPDESLLKDVVYTEKTLTKYYESLRDFPADMCLDHIDGNRMNDSLGNLRLVTVRGNCQNRKVHRRGARVGACRRDNRWFARVSVGNKNCNLGGCKDQEEASRKYQLACQMLESGKSLPDVQEHFGVRTKNRCSSKHTGVSFQSRDGKWSAYAILQGKQKHIGYFPTEEEAYQARCKYLEALNDDF